MKKLFANRQAGFGHLGLIIVIVIVLAIGGVGYFVYNKNKSNNSDGDGTVDLAAVQEAVKNAKCDYDDKDLCKFFASFKAQPYYTMTSVHEANGETTTMTIMAEGNDKTYVKSEGGMSYEMITIGKTTYTRAADGTWWKQTGQEGNAASNPQSDLAVDFDEPESTEVAQTRYKKLGKEPCGNLTCFKYQEVNPDGSSITTYLWFDDKDYQLRRMLSEGDGTKSDATFSYDKVNIKEPNPVKELGPNQYLIPGESEPRTIPDGPSPEEIEAMMQQYAQ